MSYLIWIFIGFSLMVLELFTGTMVIFFFGCAALLVGLATLMGLTTSLVTQIVLFSLLAMASLYAARARLKGIFGGVERGARGANEREHMVGLRAEAESDFRQGRGKVLLNGSSWDAEAKEDIPIQKGEILYTHGLNGIAVVVSPNKPE